MLQVNDGRKYLFTKKGRGLERLPPIHDALKQHVMRATYQGGYVWGQATIPTPVLPDPTDWGWTVGKEGHMQPRWTTISAAAVRASPLWLQKELQQKMQMCKSRCTMYSALYV